MRLRQMMAVGLAAVITALLAPAVHVQAETTQEALERQLGEQKTKNEALQQRITAIEAALKSDVCANPEAATNLLSDKPTQPH